MLRVRGMLQVTSCPAHMKASPTLKELYKGSGFDVVDLTATIEMTQQVSFANNFREADPTSWCAASVVPMPPLQIPPRVCDDSCTEDQQMNASSSMRCTS